MQASPRAGTMVYTCRVDTSYMLCVGGVQRTLAAGHYFLHCWNVTRFDSETSLGMRPHTHTHTHTHIESHNK